MKYNDLSNILNNFYDFKKKHSRTDIFPTKDLVSGKKFYKYCNLHNKYILSNILDQKIHVSVVSSFNDCFDSLPKINFNSLDLILSKYYKRRLNNTAGIHQAIFKWLKNFTNNLYCTCLTDDNNNLLMWTHYADNSKGICIEYDLLDVLDKYDTIPIPITYSNRRNSLSPSYFIPKKFGVTYEEQIEKDREVASIYTTKAECWKYENEYRIFTDVNKTGNHYIEGIKITAVYLGPRVSEDDAVKVLEVCKKIKCKVYLMKLDNVTFNYIPELIYDGVQ